MRIQEIRTCDINNGPGLTVSLWVQGCSLDCKGCHNPALQDFRGGRLFSNTDRDFIMKELSTGLQNFSCLGGEPTECCNTDELSILFHDIKQSYPSVKIWMWTGRLYESIYDKPYMKYVDILVDGKFDEDLKIDGLKWRGSSNQRIIDVKATRESKSIVLARYYYEGGNRNA